MPNLSAFVLKRTRFIRKSVVSSKLVFPPLLGYLVLRKYVIVFVLRSTALLNRVFVKLRLRRPKRVLI